ncbi:zf-HC2 domain-containing protein [Gordonia sp. (in: high G+C Gram-positive bacteria)]|uniref:zf-HC2 domain-containing protein n=1 Tax=Gordonia sp. (in: high G+C Gram-positive bacteria) TaxID=84139 RepID=UPI003C74342E
MGLGQQGRSRGSRWLPSQAIPTPLPDYRAPVGFGSTEHLNPEAVVAYVDNELTASASSRADAHLALCPDCSREVTAQARARKILQGCQGKVNAPESLRAQLSQIPTQQIDLRRDRRTNRWGR